MCQVVLRGGRQRAGDHLQQGPCLHSFPNKRHLLGRCGSWGGQPQVPLITRLDGFLDVGRYAGVVRRDLGLTGEHARCPLGAQRLIQQRGQDMRELGQRVRRGRDHSRTRSRGQAAQDQVADGQHRAQVEPVTDAYLRPGDTWGWALKTDTEGGGRRDDVLTCTKLSSCIVRGKCTEGAAAVMQWPVSELTVCGRGSRSSWSTARSHV